MLKIVVVAILLSVAVSGLSDTVVLPDGIVKGMVGSEARAFLGIPYAAPPVGDLRWAYPVPPTPWGNKVLNATVAGASCPQRCVLPPHTCPNVTSEDCLNLNVFTPLTAVDSPTAGAKGLLPVMVFIHGGRFEQGGAGSGLYNGRHIAKHSNVLVVTMNYRLGALGFVKTPALTGNYGLRDQRMVLQWVQRNIHLFGGDNQRVLLYGQSAGAASTASHLVSPLSKGLFQRAIVESDPLTLPMYPAKHADDLGGHFARDLKCDPMDVACMRSKSVAEVVDAEYTSQRDVDPLAVVSSFMPWTPNWAAGSADLPQNPFKLFIEGTFHEVPVIFGTMQNDCTMFIYMIWKNSMPWEIYDATIAGIFLEEAFKVHGMYNNASNVAGGDYRPRLGQLGTDYIFACPNRKTVLSTSRTVPTYNYVFDHIISVDMWGPRYPECRHFVCHGSELPFIFDTGDLDGFYHWSDEEAALSVEMMTYWGNFAYTGNPNVGTNKPAVEWPQFNATSMNTMHFLTGGNRIIQDYRKAECDVYDSIGYGWGVFNTP